MNYEQARKLKPDEFKRLSGVTLQTFERMVEIVEKQVKAKKKVGRPSKLSLENQILMTLEYLREYRTYFQQLDWVCWGNPSTPLVHIGKSWGLDESNVYRTIKKIENILIREKDFSLLGKRELFKENNNLKTVVIDVTESPIERPKKAVRPCCFVSS